YSRGYHWASLAGLHSPVGLAVRGAGAPRCSVEQTRLGRRHAVAARRARPRRSPRLISSEGFCADLCTASARFPRAAVVRYRAKAEEGVDTSTGADYTEKTQCARPFDSLLPLMDVPEVPRSVPGPALSCRAGIESRKRIGT